MSERNNLVAGLVDLGKERIAAGDAAQADILARAARMLLDGKPQREDLPARREGTALATEFGDRFKPYTVTYGVFGDGRIAEIFVTPEKTANDEEAIARDAAIVISIALQYGAPFEALKSAITRDGQRRPLTIIGHALDLVSTDLQKMETQS